MTTDEMIRLAIRVVPTIFFILVLLLTGFIGYRRGLRKSAILLLHAVIGFVIFTGLFFIISNQEFFEYDIVKISNFFLGDGGLQKLLNVSDKLDNLVDIICAKVVSDPNISEIIKENEAYVALIAEVSLRCVLVFVLYIMYILSTFVMYIIYLILHKESRYEKRYNEAFSKGIEPHSYQKRRYSGMLIGLFRGFVWSIGFFILIGAPMYLVLHNPTRNDKIEEVDSHIDSVDLSIYTYLTKYDNHGIYKLLNDLQDKDGFPYYLYVADYVMSGNLNDKNSDIYRHVYLYSEVNETIQFLDKASDLVYEYVDYSFFEALEEKDNDKMFKEILKVLNNREFEEEFKSIVYYSNKTHIALDIFQSFAQSILTHIEVLNLNNPEIEEVVNILFKPGYHSKRILYEQENLDKTLPTIRLNQVISRSDLNTFVDIAFDLLEYSDENNINNISIFSQLEHLMTYVKKLDLFKNEDINVVGSIRRLYGYLINTYLNSNTEYMETRIFDSRFDNVNFLNETVLLLNSLPSMMEIYKNRIENIDYSSIDYIDFIFSLNEGKTKEYYKDVKNSLLKSNLLEVVLESGFVREYFNAVMNQMFDSPYIPPEVDYISLFNMFDTLISDPLNKEALVYITSNSIDKNNFDQFEEYFEYLYESTIKEYISSSAISRSILTSVLKKAGGFIYLDDSLFDKDENNEPIYILSKEDTDMFLDNIYNMFDLARDFVKGDASQDYINDLIHNDTVYQILNSKIIEGTISKLAFEGNYFDESIKIPKNIRYVSVGGTSEIRNLIKAIKIFNLDLSDLSTITFDMMYDRLTELSLEDVKEIFESNFIYYNLSNQIFTSGKDLFKTLIIPDTVIENRTDNTIKKSVLIDFVMDIKNLYARDIHQEEILTNILTNRKRLFKESSARDIFVTTVANIIANDDSFAEYLSNIGIPNKLKEEAEISKLSYYSYTNLWNQEVINLVEGLVLLTDFDNTKSIDFTNLDSMIRNLIINFDEPYNKHLTNLDVIYNSLILSYNISLFIERSLLDNNVLDSNVIESPFIKGKSTTLGESLILRDEVYNTLEALRSLGLSFADLNTDIQISVFELKKEYEGKEVVDYICESNILRSIVTKTIDDILINSSLNSPLISFESLGGASYKIYKKREIKTLLSLVDDNGNIDQSFINSLSISRLKNIIFTGDIVNSYIILHVLSERLKEIDKIIIPLSCYDKANKIIKPYEAKLLILALEELGFGEEINVDLPDFEIADLLEKTYFFKSTIVRASLPRLVNVRFNDQSVTINLIKGNNKYVESQDLGNKNILIVKEKEMKDFLTELINLGVTSTSGSINQEKLIEYCMQDDYTYESSDIIYVYLSDLINSNQSFKFVINQMLAQNNKVLVFNSSTKINVTTGRESSVKLFKIEDVI